jgi:hypothetical protein
LEAHPVVNREARLIPVPLLHFDDFHFMKGERRKYDSTIMLGFDPEAFIVLPEDQGTSGKLLRELIYEIYDSNEPIGDMVAPSVLVFLIEIPVSISRDYRLPPSRVIDDIKNIISVVP